MQHVVQQLVGRWWVAPAEKVAVGIQRSSHPVNVVTTGGDVYYANGEVKRCTRSALWNILPCDEKDQPAEGSIANLAEICAAEEEQAKKLGREKTLLR